MLVSVDPLTGLKTWCLTTHLFISTNLWGKKFQNNTVTQGCKDVHDDVRNSLK